MIRVIRAFTVVAMLFFVSSAVAEDAATTTSVTSTLKNIEEGTGKALGKAGEVINAGVNKLDKAWETTEETAANNAASTEADAEAARAKMTDTAAAAKASADAATSPATN